MTNPAPDNEQLIAELARFDDAGPGDMTSTVRVVKDELDTLADRLRQGAQPNRYEDEAVCREVLDRVRQIGRQPDVCGATVHKPAQQELGQYFLQERLGQGGMGTVYRARHTRLDRPVAVKVLSPDRVQNADAVQRFEREMKAVGKLDHPHIVRALDAGEFEGTHYLVMELVEGQDLGRLSSDGQLPVADCCELIRQAALGLQEAHEHGMVHRDIKPSNLMLAVDPRGKTAPTVKVLDMGLALLEDRQSVAQRLTDRGQLMGTVDYMAPEQSVDTRSVDIRADVYSLAASLYRLLTGRVVFPRENYGSLAQQMRAVTDDTPVPVSELRPDVPPQLDALLIRCLSKQPDARPATPADLARELAAFVDGADLEELAARSDALRPGHAVDGTQSVQGGVPTQSVGTSGVGREGEAPSEPSDTDTGAAQREPHPPGSSIATDSDNSDSFSGNDMNTPQDNGQQAQESSASRATLPPARNSGATSTHRETVLPGQTESVAEPAEVSNTAPSQEFGRYRLEECLGQGAMGAVYKAHDTQLDRTVAIKIPKFDTSDSALLERFYREARSAATLSHTGICPVFDVGEIDGTHYISMGYIEGKPLSAFIRPEKPLSEKQVVMLTRKLTVALDAAHSKGIVHRDLKPDNVMIAGKSNPVIMDFGLAQRSASTHDIRVTQGGQMLGTPAYMSPEQVDGNIDLIGPRSDIYSLGVIVYEMLTGRLPYEGSIAAVLAQVMQGNPKPPIELRPNLNPALQAICQKLMAANPDDRYPTMADVTRDLTAFAKGQPTSVTDTLAAGAAPGAPAAPVGDEGLSALIAADDVPVSAVDAGQKPPAWAIRSGIAAAALIVLFAVYTLFIKVGDKTIHLTIDDPDAQVFVDGDEVRIENLGATIELSPGEHGVKVKRDDIVVHAERFTVLRENNPVLTLDVLDDEAVAADDTASSPSTDTGKQTADVNPDTATVTTVSSAQPPEPARAEPREIIRELAAKRNPEGVAEGVTVFPGAPGNGRVGAQVLNVALSPSEIANGTEWQFTFRNGGSARGLHIIHPWRDGQLVVYLDRTRIAINPVGENRDNYQLQSTHQVRNTDAWDEYFPLNSGAPFQIVSRLASDGHYELRVKGQIVLTASITTVTPFKLNAKFDHPKAIREWQPGMAGLMVGPRDSSGINSVSDVKLATVGSGHSGTSTAALPEVLQNNRQMEIAHWLATRCGQLRIEWKESGRDVSKFVFKADDLPLTPDVQKTGHIVGLSVLERTEVGKDEWGFLSDIPMVTGAQFCASSFGDEELAALADHAKIGTLTLGSEQTDMPQVTDAGVGHIVKMPALNYLNTHGISITPAGARQLATKDGNGRRWGSLQLTGDHLTDAVVAALQPARGDYLRLKRGQITDAAMDSIAQMAFRHIALQGSPITDAGLQKLAGKKGLGSLGLDGTLVTDAGLVHLKTIPELELLTLEDTGITAKGLESLVGFPKLKRIAIYGSKVTREEAQSFQDAHPEFVINYPNIKRGGGHRPAPDTAQVTPADPGQDVAEWALQNKVRVQFGQVQNGQPRIIRGLTFDANSVVKSEDWKRLGAVRDSITSLYIRRDGPTSEHLADLAGAPELYNLALPLSVVNPASFEHLRTLPKLYRLHINGPLKAYASITHPAADESIIRLPDLRGLNSLRQFYLFGVRVTDSTFQSATTWPAIETVEINESLVEGLAGLNKTRARSVAFKQSTLTEGCTEAISRIKSIDSLVLYQVKLADDDFVHIGRMTNLESLYLQGNQVTDAVLTHLEPVKLISLSVVRTGITRTRAQQFKNSHPDCKVIAADGSEILADD